MRCLISLVGALFFLLLFFGRGNLVNWLMDGLFERDGKRAGEGAGMRTEVWLGTAWRMVGLVMEKWSD